MSGRILAIALVAAQATSTVEAQQVEKTAVHRERIEWCDVWVEDAHKPRTPRVLLVGDSIVRGYYAGVAERLRGDAWLARFTTSAFVGDPIFLQQLDWLLGAYSFDVIHFNNGLHGSGYTEEEYAAGLSAVLDHIARRQPEAKLVLVTSTPRRDPKDLARTTEANARVEVRNRILREHAEARRLPVNDQYGLVIDHPAYHSKDGTHFAPGGKEKQAEQVAASVRSVLPAAE